MASAFDGLQSSVFDTVTNVFGEDDAVWSPSVGGEARRAKVLFNDPSESRKFIMPDYDPIDPMMEYYRGKFDGLKEAVDDGRTETVTISEIAYYVRKVTAHHDGKTYRATLSRVSP